MKSMRLDNNLDYELDQREVLIKKYGYEPGLGDIWATVKDILGGKEVV